MHLFGKQTITFRSAGLFFQACAVRGLCAVLLALVVRRSRDRYLSFTYYDNQIL